MPVFISHSHEDKEFATRLATQLLKHKARIWIDQWELRVGDSIIDNIQEAIKGASALIVILSKSSVRSEWCKKELSAGLIRELAEKRVIVLPVLVEDCDIPLFLRDKLYADFRTNFDAGLNSVLEAIAGVTSDSLGRIDKPEWFLDWSSVWGMKNNRFVLEITLVEQAKAQPYSVLTQIQISANDSATRRYLAFEKNGVGWFERALIIEMLVDGTKDEDLQLFLQDEKVKTREFGMGDPSLGLLYQVYIQARRLGEETGRDILLNLSGQLRTIRNGQRDSSPRLTKEDIATIKRVSDSL